LFCFNIIGYNYKIIGIQKYINFPISECFSVQRQGKRIIFLYTNKADEHSV